MVQHFNLNPNGMTKKIILLITTCGIVYSLHSQNRLDNSFLNGEILKKSMLSSVNLEIRTNGDREAGSAVYVKYGENYFLVTAKHVVESSPMSNRLADSIFIIANVDSQTERFDYSYLFNSEYFVAFAPDVDLAVVGIVSSMVKATLKGRGYEPLELSNIDTSWNKVKTGDVVYVVGYPGFTISDKVRKTDFGFETTLKSKPAISKGFIRDLRGAEPLFTTDAIIVYGNSGGGIFNKEKLIGITSQYWPVFKEIGEVEHLKDYQVVYSGFIKSSLILNYLRNADKMINDRFHPKPMKGGTQSVYIKKDIWRQDD